MSALALRWRQPERVLALSWRGPVDVALEAAIARGATSSIAALVGPPGPSGGSADVDVSAVAAVDIAAYLAVALDRASGQFRLADPSYKPLAFVVGLATASASTGFVVSARSGMISLPDWSAIAGTTALVPGAPYFLAPGGQISVTPPGQPSCLTIVGTAVSATTLHVEPGSPIQL